PRPFRFAVQAHVGPGAPIPTTAREFREMARRTEALGYSTLCVGDHYIDRGRITQYLAPLSALGVAAGATTTLRLGGRVFCVDYHVPAVLAKEMATLDLLSDGRVELGLGAGWNPVEYEAMGLTFHDAPQRVAKMVEVLALLRAHFSGEELDVHGAHVTAAGYIGLPLPAQRPHPPIMIGGGRKRVLSIAAREADIVSFANVPVIAIDDQGRTPHQVARERLGWVQAAAGDRFASLDIEASPYFLSITDDPTSAVDAVSKRFNAPPDIVLDHPNVLIGTAAEIEQRLLERRELYCVNYVTVPEAQLDVFAPIAQRLTGT
ncbi:MAG TPA: TIGR03621 family F420-dependent LLM class oxidoreductase, partial [Ilumatobacteraceae bacterium]